MDAATRISASPHPYAAASRRPRSALDCGCRIRRDWPNRAPEPRRYQFHNDIVTHQIETAPDQWENVYSFDLRESLPMDYEVANWFISTHPESLFRKTLLVTATREDLRLVIAFGEFTKRYPDGRAEKRPIESDEDLRDLLIREFKLPATDPAVREVTLAGPASLHATR
jgi:arylamine N-acetyltransferase